ncbi:hypothetical protein ACFE04_027149 [Oxalis oulophora]
MKGRVTWDEAKLDEIEANKPVRQKINEPKTPFHPMIHDDFDDHDGPLSPLRGSMNDSSAEDIMDADELRTALNGVASSSRKSADERSGWTSSEDEADPMEQEQDTDRFGVSFREHRRAHYDEFRKIKELRQNGSPLAEDDNEDDEVNEKQGKEKASSSLSTGGT